MIRFQHLSFGYAPNQWIFHQLNYHLKSPGLVWIEGVSGRGKSTLFSLLLKKIHPLQGRMKNTSRRTLSFHHPFVWFEQWSIQDYLKLLDISSESLKRLNLDHLPLKREVETLSGGEQGRFLLTLLLSQDADLYLLDEPCSGLSNEHQQRVIDWIAEKSQTRLVILASHLTRWQNLAHLRLQLLPHGLSQWETLHTLPKVNKAPKLKPFKRRGVLNLPSINRMFISGMILTLLGVWFLSFSLFSSFLFASRFEHQLEKTWMMYIQHYQTIPLEDSSYVLTKTSIPKDTQLYQLFASQPSRLIVKDLSPFFPSRISIESIDYTIVWYEQPKDEPLDLIQGQGPQLLSSLEWSYPIEWKSDASTIHWPATFFINIGNWTIHEGLFEPNYLFFSYQAWFVYFQSFILSEGHSLMDALTESEAEWPWVVSVDYAEYGTLQTALQKEGYRLYHPYLFEYEQFLFIIQTLQQWLGVLLVLDLIMLSAIHSMQHLLLSKKTKPFFDHARRLGLSFQYVIQSVYHREKAWYLAIMLLVSIGVGYGFHSWFTFDFWVLILFSVWLSWGCFLFLSGMTSLEKKIFYASTF